jgi:hypothetical protein
MRGIVFTADSAMAVAVLMIVAATTVTLMELSSQPDQELQLYRLARDVYEVKYYDSTATLPSWISTNCDSAEQVGSERSIRYDGGGNVREVITKVCLNG